MQPMSVQASPSRGCVGLDLAQVRARLDAEYTRLSCDGGSANDRQRLEQTATALGRIDSGVYGICASCHRSIGRARLEAVPCTTLCVHCQQLAQCH